MFESELPVSLRLLFSSVLVLVVHLVVCVVARSSHEERH